MYSNIFRTVKITFLLFMGCIDQLHSQVEKGYVIEGQIKGLQEGEKILMRLGSTGMSFTSMDSAYVKDGKFKITGTVPSGPRAYWMLLGSSAQFVRLCIDNGEHISIDCDKNVKEIKHNVLEHFMTINGSPSNYSWHCLIPAVQILRENLGIIRHRMKEIKDSVGFDKASIGIWMKAKNQLIQSMGYMLLKDPEPDEALAIPMCSYFDIFDLSAYASYWPEVYNKMSDHLKNSFYGKLLKKRLNCLAGQPFPEFTLPTPEGKNLSLSEIVSKSKLTLVQFWASNSIDIDDYQQELKEMYKKYHDKGLNIIGVSSDTAMNKWKAGILSNDLPWYQVSDLKGEKGVVETVYHEYGEARIPNTTNVLIDAKGKIVAWDKSGIELQWYLSDALDK